MHRLLDSKLEHLTKSLTPRWTELRLREAPVFQGEAKLPYLCSELLFVGEPNLVCGINALTWDGSESDYFPLYLEICSLDDLSLENYQTFAQRGGATSDFERRLQWVFEGPSLLLLEGVDEYDDPNDSLCFYVGLELTDPKTGKSLQLLGTKDSDFSINLTIKD